MLDEAEDQGRELCCGCFYQAQGAFACCKAVCCDGCCGTVRHDTGRVVPHFLDLWTMTLLGAATIAFLATIILVTYLEGEDHQDRMDYRYR